MPVPILGGDPQEEKRLDLLRGLVAKQVKKPPPPPPRKKKKKLILPGRY